MGRIADLCGEVAAEAEEGPDGLILSAEAWDRLRADWSDEDIEDAMAFVRDSLLQSELVEAADSLSTRLVEFLGGFGEAQAFGRAEAGQAQLSLEVIDQLVRRVGRLEEVLDVFRESGTSPDRSGFDALMRRIVDQGIEDEMWGPKRGGPPSEDEES